MKARAAVLSWEVHVSKAQEKVNRIRDEKIGATNKRVLLVEGSDDVSAFSQLLGRRFPGWQINWELVAAGNKRQALEMASLAPDWLALVDCDEWSASEIAVHQAAHRNLLILPRFCLESYLVDPAELWLALPPQQQQKITNGADGLATEILQNLDDWKRHAALWHVINPLWAGLRALGFKDALLKTQAIPNDRQLTQTLQEWSNFVDVDRILADVQTAITRMSAEPLPDFLQRSLYAKEFYPQVVHPVLDHLLGQKTMGERRIGLFKTLVIPGDLDFVWQRMRLL